MTFLKTLGRYIVEGLQILAGIQPVFASNNQANIGTVITKVESDLQQLVGIITTVEAVGTSLGLAGTDKVRAAGPLVAQLILQSSMMVGKSVANGPAFAAAAQTIAGGVADLLNSLSAQSIVTAPPMPVPVPAATPVPTPAP